MHSISSLFQGRLGRAHFAWACLVLVVIAIVINILTYALDLLGDSLGMLASIVSVIVFIAIAIVSLGISVRRYHDLDWSGWFVLLGFIPIVNLVMLIVLLFKQGTPAANRFGEPFAKDMPLKEAILNKHAAPHVVATGPTTPITPATPAASVEPAQDAGPKTDLV